MSKKSSSNNDSSQNADFNQLVEATLSSIKKIAKKHRRSHNQVTLQTTEIVHETYIKLLNSQVKKWEDRSHFLVTFSRVMKNFLVDQYRKKATIKRGEGVPLLDIDMFSSQVAMPDNLPIDWLELELKLKELKQIDQVAHDIVMLRYFAGLDIPEIASTLNISESSVSRSWTFARTWLHTKLK